MATGSERWLEAATALERRAELSSTREERAHLRLRAARLCVEHLGDLARALRDVETVLDEGADHPDALEFLEAMSRDNPELAADIDALLERAYEARDDATKLSDVLSRRIERADTVGERRDLRLRLADLAINRTRDMAMAYAVLEAAFADEPDDVYLRERLQAAADAAGQHERLVEAFGRVLQSPATDATDGAIIASIAAELCEERLSDPERAVGFHQRVLSLEPLNDRSFSALKEAYTGTESWDQLHLLYLRRISETVDVEAKQTLLLQLCFVAEELIEDVELAIEAYRDVLELEPYHEAACRALEKLYARKGRWRESGGALQAAT